MAKIMLVEDAADTRDLITQILGMEGHTVDCAETGEESITKIQALPLPPDVILMDMSLPGRLSGLDVVQFLRADSAFDRTPILALTAHALVDDRRRSLEVGCDEHITKPIFDLKEFAEIVSRYAEQGRK
ncbi:MAG TPA: response regulator [Pyrinomonadaceae bacterium]|nr:response regulator [Pyrinomonadaceae bacterium]